MTVLFRSAFLAVLPADQCESPVIISCTSSLVISLPFKSVSLRLVIPSSPAWCFPGFGILASRAVLCIGGVDLRYEDPRLARENRIGVPDLR